MNKIMFNITKKSNKQRRLSTQMIVGSIPASAYFF